MHITNLNSHSGGSVAPGAARIFKRAAVFGIILVASLASVLWLASMIKSIGIFSLGGGTSLRFVRGVAEIRHIYAYNIERPVPSEQWFQHAASRGWLGPSGVPRRLVPWFAYRSGQVLGIGQPPDNGMTSPASCWTLQIPLWLLLLPAIILVPFGIRAYRTRRQVQRRGFPISVGNQRST